MQPHGNTCFIVVSLLGFLVVLFFFFLVKPEKKKGLLYNLDLNYQAADSNLGCLSVDNGGINLTGNLAPGRRAVMLWQCNFGIAECQALSVNKDLAIKYDFYMMKKSCSLLRSHAHFFHNHCQKHTETKLFFS